HLAHRGEPGNMDELRLQFLQSSLGSLPLGQVAYESGEETPVAGVHFADGKLHGESRPVSPFADHDTSDADDAPLSGAKIALKIAVMAFAVGRGHQHLDVLADDVAR